MTRLEQQILKTCVYFDLFDFPLTAVEVQEWLWKASASYSDVEAALCELVARHKLVEQDGFYAIFGRNVIFATRQASIPIIEEKLAIAKKAVRYIRHVPFVRAVYVCNTVAGSVPRPDSDIDVFVILSHGRLWLSRLLITIILSAAGLRRTKTQVTNRICLSFYMTDASFDLSRVAIPSMDIYLAYWIYQLIPIMDPEQLLADIHRQNGWVWELLPNASLPQIVHPAFHVHPSLLARVSERLLRGSVGTVLEGGCRMIQKKKMPQRQIRRGTETHVIVSDQMLKFHERDRRRLYRDLWQSRCFALYLW